MINVDFARRDRQQLILGVIARTLMDDKREAARKWLDRLPQRPYQPEVAMVLRGSK